MEIIAYCLVFLAGICTSAFIDELWKKLVLMCLYLGGFGFMMVYIIKTEESKYNFPEEIALVSKDRQHPDTMIVWKDNDTTKFRFVIAARNYPEANK